MLEEKTEGSPALLPLGFLDGDVAMAVTKCSPGGARAEVFDLLPHLCSPEKGNP